MEHFSYRYPHPAVTTDTVVFGYDGLRLNVLLIERGGEPYKGQWAFPGGFLNIDEDAPDGARRELLEETGYGGGTWREIMTVGQNPSICDNITHCFLAEGVERVQGQQLDAGEDIAVLLLSRDEVESMLRENRQLQALMAAPLWRYLAEHPTSARSK
jgi:ADP-ribose pyrophosphatase YjhB (NUDIX family)